MAEILAAGGPRWGIRWAGCRAGVNCDKIGASLGESGRRPMAKRAKRAKGRKRVAWTKGHERELRGHSRAKTPVAKIVKAMKRTAGALRQKAHAMGLSLGHRR
jgi:hypothetical protein